ncbi:MAG: nucleotide sugar dehydrogenase [Ignavibacteriales bacterium]|nr:nucleotide sugar dehydrogenase [Ignavibacteriales bacterium]
MKINIFGLGYVGCVSAACLAKNNHNVNGIDIDPVKVSIINSGKSPIVEEGLDELISETVKSGNLKAFNGGQIPEADLSIICVGTPSHANGSLSLNYFTKVAEQIGEYLKNTKSYHVVVNRSTVLPGTIENILIPTLEKFSDKKAGQDFGISMNPEFMREGTSILDYYNPPFTLIGELDSRSGDVVEKIYNNVEAQIFRSNIKVAEMVKYSCNTFHAVKVTFANEIGNICKQLGIDSHEVMDIFSQDTKLNISTYYLKPGFAFGGSCLPKDLRAITYKAKELDLSLPLLNALIPSNQNQIESAFKLISKSKKKKIGVLGLSFKAGTDDLRESPIVELIEKLIGKGYSVKIYDQEVAVAKIFGSNKKYIETAIPHISSLMSDGIEDVIQESEIIIIGKNEKSYKEPILKASESVHIIDLVKMFNKTEAPKDNYEGIGW